MSKWKKFLMEKMHIQLQTVAENTTVAFQQCLADVGIVMDAMFDLNEWAFHCELQFIIIASCFYGQPALDYQYLTVCTSSLY